MNEVYKHNSICSSYLPWTICLMASTFFLFAQLQTNLINALTIYVMPIWHITAQELGDLAFYYFLAAGIFFMPVGILLDYYGARRVILIGLIICISGSCLFASATSFMVAKIGRFLAGIGYPVALLSCFRLGMEWLPSRIAFVTGITTMVGLLGSILAQIPITIISNKVGLHVTLWLNVLLGILVFVLIDRLVIDHSVDIKKILFHNFEVTLWIKLKSIFFNHRNWLCAIYACFLNTPILLFGDLWGNLYLIQTKHVTNQQASLINTMLFLGIAIGCPLIGLLSDYFRQKFFFMIFNAFCLLFLISPIFLKLNLSFSDLMALYFTWGFLASTQSLCYPVLADSNPKNLIGIATGFTTTLIMAGNAGLQLLFAYLMSVHWHGLIINNMPLYSLYDYQFALLIMPIGFLICLVTVLLMATD